MKEASIRWGLLLIGATVGLIGGVVYFIIIEHFRGPFAKDSFALIGALMSALAVFYLVIYGTGFIGYRMIHRHQQAEQVIRIGSGQLLLMHGLILLMAVAGWFIP